MIIADQKICNLCETKGNSKNYILVYNEFKKEWMWYCKECAMVTLT